MLFHRKLKGTSGAELPPAMPTHPAEERGKKTLQDKVLTLKTSINHSPTFCFSRTSWSHVISAQRNIKQEAALSQRDPLYLLHHILPHLTFGDSVTSSIFSEAKTEIIYLKDMAFPTTHSF